MATVKNSIDRPMTAIACLLAGVLLFSLQDVAIKHFSAEYSVLQIVVVRGVVAVMVVAAILFWIHGPAGFAVRQPGLIVSKGLLAFLSYLVYYMAIASLPLADVVAITFSAPILVIVLSALLLREPVGPRRWLAVVVGFVGVLIVVGPSGKMANLAVSLAALAAFSYALSSVIARYIGPEDRPWTVTFYFTLAHFLGGCLVSALVFFWAPVLPDPHPSMAFLLRPWASGEQLDLLSIGVLGVNAAAGFYFLNKAYLSAPASTVAPFEYTYLLWAILFGYLLWSEVPEATTFVGVALLIGSNLYILQRELVGKRQTRVPSIGKGPGYVAQQG